MVRFRVFRSKKQQVWPTAQFFAFCFLYKTILMCLGKLIIPHQGQYCSLLFLSATPSSWSRPFLSFLWCRAIDFVPFERSLHDKAVLSKKLSSCVLFEMAWHPSKALNLASRLAFRATEKQRTPPGVPCSTRRSLDTAMNNWHKPWFLHTWWKLFFCNKEQCELNWVSIQTLVITGGELMLKSWRELKEEESRRDDCNGYEGLATITIFFCFLFVKNHWFAWRANQ